MQTTDSDITYQHVGYSHAQTQENPHAHAVMLTYTKQGGEHIPKCNATVRLQFSNGHITYLYIIYAVTL